MTNLFSFFILFVFIFTISAQVSSGVYRQCDFNTGDEVFLTVGSGTNPRTEMHFNFGGCLDGLVQYEIIATYDWVFSDPRPDGGFNVEYNYISGVAIPHTQDAAAALENTCGSRFTIDEETNILGCLFCPTRYDIYLQLEEDVFVLGDGIACDEADRPTQYEESKYVEEPYYEFSDPGINYSTIDYTFSYVNADDDVDDDFFPDEDDETTFYDDDNDNGESTDNYTTFTFSAYGTFSNSPGNFETTSDAKIIVVCFTLIISSFFILL